MTVDALLTTGRERPRYHGVMASPKSRLRWSISLAAAILVPGGLLAGWAVLRFGGTIAGQEALERQQATRALKELGTSFQERLKTLQSQGPGVFSMAVGPDGRLGTPFVDPPGPATWQPPAGLGVALETARELLAAGEPARALPFFRNGAGDDPASMEPAAVLAMARCLHALGATGEALVLLVDAASVQANVWLDGLPFPTLAALLELRIAHELGDGERHRAVQDRLLSGALPIPARGARLVMDQLAEADPRDVEDLLRAAAVSITHGFTPAGPAQPGPDGSVLLLRSGSLLVLAPWRVEELIAEIGAENAPRYPSLMLTLDTGPGWLASAKLEPLARVVYASPAGELGSERTAELAGILALAALGTFVLGNLLLLGLARREMALSRMRSNFIDLVSHELRTPLTALSLKAEMLAGGEVPRDKVGDYQRALHREVEKLAALVQRILDFARLQKAHLPLEPVRIPGRRLLADGIRAGREALRLGNQRLCVSAPRELPDLWVDREVMTRALRNLIENSSRYAPEGSLVELRASADGEGLRLILADRGPGLGDGDVRELFEPFRRRAGPSTPGSGLGLAIVKQAVEAHGGSVTARNRDGGGAEFRIDLPLARRAS